MNIETPPVALSRPQRLGALLVPWAFVVVIGALYAVVLLPRIQAGHLLTLIAGLLAGLVYCVMVIAAITFSQDILKGRWPLS